MLRLFPLHYHSRSKQQEYANEQAELQRQEAIRQYNEQMAFKKAQEEEAIRQYNENLALQKARQDEEIRRYNDNLALQRQQLAYQQEQDAIANAQKWASINSPKTSSSEVPVIEFTDGNGSVKNNTTKKNQSYVLSSQGNQLYTNLSKSINAITKLPIGGALLKQNALKSALITITKAYENGQITSRDADILFDKLGIDSAHGGISGGGTK